MLTDVQVQIQFTFTNPPAITLTVGQTNVSCNWRACGIATATQREELELYPIFGNLAERLLLL